MISGAILLIEEDFNISSLLIETVISIALVGSYSSISMFQTSLWSVILIFLACMQELLLDQQQEVSFQIDGEGEKVGITAL